MRSIISKVEQVEQSIATDLLSSLAEIVTAISLESSTEALKEHLDRFYTQLAQIHDRLRSLIAEAPDAGIPRFDRQMLEAELSRLEAAIPTSEMKT